MGALGLPPHNCFEVTSSRTSENARLQHSVVNGDSFDGDSFVSQSRFDAYAVVNSINYSFVSTSM